MDLEEFIERNGLKMRYLAKKMNTTEGTLRYHVRGNFRDGKGDKRGTALAKQCAQVLKEILVQAHSDLKELTLGDISMVPKRAKPEPETPVNQSQNLSQKKKGKGLVQRE